MAPTVSFVHHFDFAINLDSDSYYTATFYTCYKTAAVKWEFALYPTSGSQIHVRLCDKWVEIFVLPYSFHYTVSVGQEQLCEERSFSEEDDGALDPATHPVHTLIASLRSLKKACTFNFTITILMDRRGFEWNSHAEFSRFATRYHGLYRDFRHASLDPARHDFTIVCRGGVSYGASKEALFHTSYYFNHLFNAQHSDRLDEDCDYEAVKCVVTWLLCGEYAAPVRMTPQLAQEIVLLAEKYDGYLSKDSLFNGVQEGCYELFHEGSNRLESVLGWLPLVEAVGSRVERLASAVTATLTLLHWTDLCEAYGEADPSRSPTHRLLHERPGQEGAATVFEQYLDVWRSRATAFLRSRD